MKNKERSGVGQIGKAKLQLSQGFSMEKCSLCVGTCGRAYIPLDETLYICHFLAETLEFTAVVKYLWKANSCLIFHYL